MTAIGPATTLVDFIEVSASTLAAEGLRLQASADVPGLAALLAAVRRGRATLALLESEIETLLAGLMSSNVVVVDGVGVLERRGGRKRSNWDHARLASMLAARVADQRRVDPDTGEILARPPGRLAQDVVDELLTCAGVSYWKVGELRARSVDPSSFCEEEPGRASVMVRPNA
ncbi:MAG: hypothetical protein ACRDYV_03240 [Acidimicrobiia bacterium]